MVNVLTPNAGELVEQLEFYRLDAGRKLDGKRRAELGQFFTPAPTARLMASMFEAKGDSIRLLDAGAGVGSLTAAWVSEICRREERPRQVSVSAFEIDSGIRDYLKATLEACGAECETAGIRFTSELLREDFIEAAVPALRGSMFASQVGRFDCAILNPPYRKINSDSRTRQLLRTIGVETSNLYTAFLSLVIGLLEEGGELVTITPRSFCNGLYFRPFRAAFLREMTVRRVHVFDARNVAFGDDGVLQENVIFRSVKNGKQDGNVVVSSSSGPEDEVITVREVSYDQMVSPSDPNSFIRIVADDIGDGMRGRMEGFGSSLNDLGLGVSTGRVVEFRAEPWLRREPGEGTVPLIYPGHFHSGFVEWPKPGSRKPNALLAVPKNEDQVVKAGYYALVKRFSSKEERRRIVAAMYDPSRIPADRVGFENHLNYYHIQGGGLPVLLAKGLTAFLNSTLVDSYFRQFNGHTQVNATDLRSLNYPSRAQLEALGARIAGTFPEQDELDRLIDEELPQVEETSGPNPVLVKKRLDEALRVLKDLGLPRQQQNERSALTLLALLDLKPDTQWAEAIAPLRGITPMMDFFAEHYGRHYMPNTRESVRRFTVHQFMQAGLVNQNPDDPARPTNSGKNVYQIETSLLEMLRTFGSTEWDKDLRTYLASIETLQKKYAQARQMQRIPVTLASGEKLTLSPGGQNVLVQQIIEEFCQRFTPGAEAAYIGDTDEKFAYFDSGLLGSLGVSIEPHGKMPDVVVYYREKGWLVLIEAVTSHGPVNAKRHEELTQLFGGSTAGLVFVTAFLDRRAMTRYLEDISWETEVWVADVPTHMIHFNGERFLGPS